MYTLKQLLEMKPPVWLVESIIPEGGLVALYGQPGDGKSFIALDIALSIASGIPWQGHEARKGYVVYISAEGGAGIAKRVGAWLEHHRVSRREMGYLFANFVVSAVRVHAESEDLADMVSRTVEHPEYLEMVANATDPDDTAPLPLFIVVDTLARCFQGDENLQEDMGNFIKGLDTLREAHDATVLVVHHTGRKGVEERGSSSFRGACDTMMAVVRDKDNGTMVLSCTKQKDHEDFPDEILELRLVPSWDSCAVESTVLRQQKEVTEETLAIQSYLEDNPGTPVREVAAALGLSHGTAQRRMKQIESKTPLGTP